MVNDGNNQFSNVLNNIPDGKKTKFYSQFHILINQFLIGCSPRLDNEYIRIGEGAIQYVTIESKHGFLGFTGFRF